MATPDHTPHGRGYQTALHYFHHANDYWTCKLLRDLRSRGCFADRKSASRSDKDGGGCKHNNVTIGGQFVDSWQTNLDAAGTQGPAHGYNNTCGEPNHLGAACSLIGPKSDHW